MRIVSYVLCGGCSCQGAYLLELSIPPFIGLVAFEYRRKRYSIITSSSDYLFSEININPYDCVIADAYSIVVKTSHIRSDYTV